MSINSDTDRCELVTKIDLGNKGLVDEDMNRVIQESLIDKKCSSLWLHDNILTSHSVRTLTDSILIHNQLQVLFLDGNQISNIGVHYLCLVLNRSALISLSLSECGISDDGVKELAETLKSNKNLRDLWLYHNRIGDNGAQALAATLTRDNTTLERVDLRSNKPITDASVEHLLLMLELNQSLRTFWMEYCSLSFECKTKLRQSALLKKGLNFGT